MSTLQEQAKKEANDLKQRTMFGRVFTLGVNFIAGPLVLGLFGRWLDHKTGHEYRYFFTGVILGLVWALYESFKMAWYMNRDEKRAILKMDRKTSLFILVSEACVLAASLAVALFIRPAVERVPIMLGWAVAGVNFALAIIISQNALKKSFEAFKLMLMVWTGARLGAMLAILIFIIKCNNKWTTSFSGSLLSCFGIYIILEVAFFYTKAKRLMS